MNMRRQKESALFTSSSRRRPGSFSFQTPEDSGSYAPKGIRQNGGREGESGNALIYVLIAIALFAALSFTLGRQTDTGETGTLDDDRAGLAATQLISYASQAKSALDQMLFANAFIDDIIFTLPGDASFNTAPRFNKIYHPDGGGLSPGTLPAAVIAQSSTDPTPGWYMGRFNNVDWTATGGNDIILVAYQISGQVCAFINQRITGSATIPVMTDSIKETMIDDSFYTAGTNLDLTTDAGEICPECHEMSSLCVQNADQDAYGFYTILADQ